MLRGTNKVVLLFEQLEKAFLRLETLRLTCWLRDETTAINNIASIVPMDALLNDDDHQFFCCCCSSSSTISSSESYCLSSSNDEDDDNDWPCPIGRLNRRHHRLMSDGNPHLWLTMEQGIRVAAAAVARNRLKTRMTCSDGCCNKTVSAAADETPFHCHISRCRPSSAASSAAASVIGTVNHREGRVFASRQYSTTTAIRKALIIHRNQHKSGSSSSWVLNHVLISTTTCSLAIILMLVSTVVAVPPPLSSSSSSGLIAEAVLGRDMLANNPSMMMSIGGGGGNLVLVHRTDPAAADDGREPSTSSAGAGVLYGAADFARIAGAAAGSSISMIRSNSTHHHLASTSSAPAITVIAGAASTNGSYLSSHPHPRRRDGNEVDDEGDAADGRSRVARRMSKMGVKNKALILDDDDETINNSRNRRVDSIVVGATYSSITHSHARASSSDDQGSAVSNNSVHHDHLSAGEDADDIGSVRWKNPDISKSLHKKYRLLRKTCASEVLRELASEDWKLFKRRTTTGDTVHVLNDGLSGTVYLLTGIVDLDPDSLFHAIVDDPYAITKWNPAIKKINVLQHVNNRTLIFHQVLNQKSAGLFRERDFVNMNFWKKQRDTFYQFYESVEFPGCPESAEYVRGENGPSGFVFAPYYDSDDDISSNSSSSLPDRPTSSNRTRYQWLMDVDFKFQWMFQRLLKNVIPGVMFEYMDSVRRRAEQVANDNNKNNRDDEGMISIANHRQHSTDDAASSSSSVPLQVPTTTDDVTDFIRRALGWSNMNKGDQVRL